MHGVSPRRSPISFSNGELTISGERWGEEAPGRPLLLFLHGGGQTRHSWDRSASRLAEAGWPGITLDLRGHGDSSWAPDGDYSLEAFAADLAAVLDQLDAPSVLIGASLGGITSLTVVGEGLGTAAGLVLVDVVVAVEPVGVQRIQDFMTANPNGFASLEEVADAIAAYNPARKRPTNLEGLKKNVRLGDDGRWRWHWDPAFMRIGDEPQRHIDRARLEAAAENVKVPTLIVRGGKSDVVSDEGIDDMRRRIPQAQLADVAVAGHMVAGDDNDVFTSALERFLKGLPAPR